MQIFLQGNAVFTKKSWLDHMLNDHIGRESSSPFVSGVNPGHDGGMFFPVQITCNRSEKSVSAPVRDVFL